MQCIAVTESKECLLVMFMYHVTGTKGILTVVQIICYLNLVWNFVNQFDFFLFQIMTMQIGQKKICFNQTWLKCFEFKTVSIIFSVTRSNSILLWGVGTKLSGSNCFNYINIDCCFSLIQLFNAIMRQEVAFFDNNR